MTYSHVDQLFNDKVGQIAAIEEMETINHGEESFETTMSDANIRFAIATSIALVSLANKTSLCATNSMAT